MPQQSPSTFSPPPDPSFVPRKEFIREQKTVPSSFAIVTISASSLVRLYSFPSSVIIALRVFLEASSSLVAFREDVQQHFCEFALAGRPWASPKSVRAEKLLVDILAVLYQCGYTYLSSLDYGRESDDRLAMAFSKPSTSPSTSSRSATPLPGSTSPFQERPISITSDKSKSRRSPFALSFLSPTLMRVIAPPLHLTPAILQAVRASWPRGVVSERKVGDNSFEFKLKGYKWFEQDTFATDSLRHILALLTSLDSQSFTLLSSLSMTSRSRVKDLWVFTGPGSDTPDDLVRQEYTVLPSARDGPNGDINRTHSPETSGQFGSYPGFTQHRRFVSESGGPSTYVPHHIRATIEQDNARTFSLTRGYRAEHPSMGPALLRKPAPRAQVPVSVVHEADPPGTDGLRAYLPSSISSDVEDMTGVGAKGFFPGTFQTVSSESPEQSLVTATDGPVPLSPPLSTTPPTRPRSPLRPVVNRQKTPPLLTTNLTPNSPTHNLHNEDPGTALLGSRAFRDSTASTSDTSFSVPTQWTRVGDAIAPQKEANPVATSSRRKISSSGPMLPGSWQPSPIEEKTEGPGGITELNTPSEDSASQDKIKTGNKTPIHEVASRVASPELTRPDMPLRKSEAALVGLITDASPVPALPTSEGHRLDSSSSGKGQGWVLVNVGESLTGSKVGLGEPLDSKAPESEHLRPSPNARAIAVVDAIDNKKKGKDKSNVLAPVKKRFFGLGRKNSEKRALASGIPQVSVGAESHKARSGFRDRFRITSTSQGARKDQDH